MELRTGDYVYISNEALSSSPDGWVEGTSWLTGVSGFLPESYIQRTAESDAWTLHKKISLNQLSPTDLKNSLQEITENSTPSAFTNDDIKYPTPPIMEDQSKGGSGGGENVYQNLLDVKKEITTVSIE